MRKYLYFIILISFVLTIIPHGKVFSQNIEVIKEKIDNHNQVIKQLDEEIKKYSKEVEVVSSEAKTLQSAIKTLDVSKQKITTEIKKTETTIQKTNLTIEQLDEEIKILESRIDNNVSAIAKVISSINENDNNSIIESFLSNKSLSEILNEVETLNQFQQNVRERTVELTDYKNQISQRKEAKETEKNNLLGLKSELGDKNKILEINKKEKSTLLTATKNKESEYKRLLAEKQAQKEQFEKELFQFESELKRTIDPASFPSGKKGILAWPLDNIFVTQPFGKTIDSKRLYTSGTHNGVDFRASRGTPVKAVLDGVIQGAGNTDAQRGCYSYGKWVLIKHPNGLTSLYAHLDLIKVNSGQSVNEGEIIGYSGQTGYATGPHLHLTLYASQGVEIQRYSSSRNCKNVDIPVADKNAYLDPMLYF